MTKPRLRLLGNMASPDPGLPAEVRQLVAAELAMLVTMAHEFAAQRRADHIAAGLDADAVDAAARDVYDLAGRLHDRARQWRSAP